MIASLGLMRPDTRLLILLLMAQASVAPAGESRGPTWADRRPIGTVHPSSSHLGAGTVGPTTNPRGWALPGDPVDVTTLPGRASFNVRMFDYARRCVAICRDMNAQGVIVWSLEGQEFPHAISYIGNPPMLPELAPEMDAIADLWFAIFSKAGLRTGVCIRPQRLERDPRHDPSGSPTNAPFRYRQSDLWTDGGAADNEAILAELTRKARYARDRWGCSIFYVDSNVAMKGDRDRKSGVWRPTYWMPHAAEIYERLAKRFPDCLIVPEHATPKYWSCTAPLGVTKKAVRWLWPDAFSVNLMQKFNPDDTDQVGTLERAVAGGDVLLFPAWYKAPGNATVKEIYRKNYNPGWHGELERWKN